MPEIQYSTRKKTAPIVYFTIFIYLLMQNRCWIGFSGRTIVMTFVLVVLLFLFFLVKKVNYKIKKSYLWFSILVFVSSFYSYKLWTMNVFGWIGWLVPAINILFILSIPDQDKNDFLHHLIRWFGLILIPSLFLFFITFFFQIPSLGTIAADYGFGASESTFFYNYIFYLKPLNISNVGFPRFNGPFIEPGDVGCATAFILFSAKYNFKEYKYLWVLLVSLVVSFSLAGWMLGFLGYFLTLFVKREFKGSTLIFVIMLLLGVYTYGLFVNGGDNPVNKLIIERLQYDEDFGITGNQRTTLMSQEYFFAMFSNPTVLFFGYDESTIDLMFGETGTAGFIAQAVKWGMVGMFLLVLPFLYITLKSKDRRYGWAFFILLIAFLAQRAGVFWVIFVITYVYGIAINDRKKLGFL